MRSHRGGTRRFPKQKPFLVFKPDVRQVAEESFRGAANRQKFPAGGQKQQERNPNHPEAEGEENPSYLQRLFAKPPKGVIWRRGEPGETSEVAEPAELPRFGRICLYRDFGAEVPWVGAETGYRSRQSGTSESRNLPIGRFRVFRVRVSRSGRDRIQASRADSDVLSDAKTVSPGTVHFHTPLE